MPRIFQTFLASKRGAIVTDNQGHDLSYRTFINELPPRSSTLLLNPQI
jgi:hypothetical protein